MKLFPRLRAAIAAFRAPQPIDQDPGEFDPRAQGAAERLRATNTTRDMSGRMVQAHRVNDVHTGDHTGETHHHGPSVTNTAHGPVGAQMGHVHGGTVHTGTGDINQNSGVVNENSGVVNLGGSNTFTNTTFGTVRDGGRR